MSVVNVLKLCRAGLVCDDSELLELSELSMLKDILYATLHI